MAISQDSYLQAAEGFLFTVRDEIDQLDLRLDDSLKIAEVFALVSIARSLSRMAPPERSPVAADHGHEPEAALQGNVASSHP